MSGLLWPKDGAWPPYYKGAPLAEQHRKKEEMPAATIQLSAREVYQEHQYQRHNLGTKGVTSDGRTFRYARNGAVLGIAGNVQQGALPVANHNETVVGAARVRAVGDLTVSSTLGGTAAAVDLYAEGYVHVNKTDGVGTVYTIHRAYKAGDGHAAVSSGAVITANIDAPIKVALVAASELAFSKNPYDATIIMPSPATAVTVGVMPHAVTAAYYYWLQTGGVAGVLADASCLIGDVVVGSASNNGAVMPSAAYETDGPAVGILVKVPATGEYGAVSLTLDN